jgi:hypothetical protein
MTRSRFRWHSVGSLHERAESFFALLRTSFGEQIFGNKRAAFRQPIF